MQMYAIFAEKNPKNYWEVRDHCYYTVKYRGAACSICHLRFNVPDEVPVVFHNGWNYDYHFIIKEFASEFQRQFDCYGKNKEKYKMFSALTKKEITKIDKDGNKSVVNISYKIKFIDSARLMVSSLSNLVNNLAEGIHKIECKDCDCFLVYESVKDDSIKYKLFIL